METIQGIPQFKSSESIAITIGTFDGVHVGHKRILERLSKNAQKIGAKSMVLTFFPHPRMILQKDSEIKLLNTLSEKQQILSELGIDYLIVHPFTKAFSRLTALEFVRDLLVDKLHAKSIIIGYDHRFGRNRRASIEELKGFGNTFDFEVEEISAQEIDEVSVSSTKIRNSLMGGDIQTANAYLGYAYMLSGKIIKGKGLGKVMDFPTANIKIVEPYKLIPQNGVYIVRCKLGKRIIFGMMNIGYNPTVSGTERSIEVNFFKFEGNLYDQTIQVVILHRIRDEHKFDSVQELQEQLKKDKEQSLVLISKQHA